MVKTKMQLKILFIPFVNTAILFIWIFKNLRCLENVSYYKELYKSLIFLVIVFFFVTIPLLLLTNLVNSNYPEIISLFEFFSYYAFSVSLMGSLIWYQKRKGID